MAPLRFGLCPNGYCFSLAAVLVMIATGLSIWTSVSCRYFTSRGIAEVLWLPDNSNNVVDPSNGAIENPNDSLRVAVGLWSVQKVQETSASIDNPEQVTLETDTCTQWSSGQKDAVFDTYFQVARVMALIVVAAALLFTITILMIALVRFPETLLRNCYRCMFCSYGFLACLVAVTFVVLASDLCADDCKLDRAGWGVILAFIFWTAASIVICCTPIRHRERKEQAVAAAANNDDDNDDSDRDPKDDNSSTQVEEAQDPVVNITERTTEEADGTIVKIVTTTTTFADGTQKVREHKEVVKPPVTETQKNDDGTRTTTKVEEREIVNPPDLSMKIQEDQKGFCADFTELCA